MQRASVHDSYRQKVHQASHKCMPDLRSTIRWLWCRRQAPSAARLHRACDQRRQHQRVQLHSAALALPLSAGSSVSCCAQSALETDETAAAASIPHVFLAQLQGVDAVLFPSQAVALDKEHIQCDVYWLKVREVVPAAQPGSIPAYNSCCNFMQRTYSCFRDLILTCKCCCQASRPKAKTKPLL